MDEVDEILKLKVAELRAELQKRGLDSKGVKAVLIERLREAMETDKNEGGGDVDEEPLKVQEEGLEKEPEPEPEPDQEQEQEQEEAEAAAPEQNGEQEDEHNGQAEPEPEPEPEEEHPHEQPEEELPHEQPDDAKDKEMPEKEEANVHADKKNDFEEAPLETVDDIKKESEESEMMDKEYTEIPREYEAKREPEIKEENVEAKEDMETNEEQQERQSSDRRGVKRSRSPLQEEPDMSKRYRPDVEELRVEDEPEFDPDEVALDWYNSDLSLIVDKDRLSASPLVIGGFAYVWHGVRATYGYVRGRLFYEVKVEDHLPVEHLENEEQHPHVVRCGWSIDDASMTLGEEKMSYGYGGTGKASTNLKFKDYGKMFGKGDVIGCYLDMESEPIMMSFTVNGEHQGICYEITNRELGDQPLFPHILTKNCSFKVNFGNEEPWFEPLTGYTFVANIQREERVLGTQGPESRDDCEAIMMVGLPAAGKTTWADEYCRQNMHKKYNVLGTNNLIDKMKVMGLPRKRNYAGRWDTLIEKCTKCLNKLLYMATKRRRNFIIDQTNVYPSAQKRKIKGFSVCKRRAIVVCPTDDDLKTRTRKREVEEGKDVPDRAVLEMKANFKLPEEGEFFDSIEFTELQQEEAEKLIEQYNREGEKAGFGPKKFRGGGGGRRGGNYIDRRGGYGGHRGGGGYRGGWDRDRDRRGSFDRRDRGGSWNRDNRDNRDRGGYRDRGFHRDNRGNRNSGGSGGGGSGGSWQGGYKGSNQSNLKQTSTWGGSQNSQSSGYSGSGSSGGGSGGSQGSWGGFGSSGNNNNSSSSWGQQGYGASAYNWNQQYYGQQQQAQQPNYWQGYGSQQTGYTAPTPYNAQSSYGTAQSSYTGSYGQQQPQQTTTPQWNYTSNYQSQYRK